MKNWAQFHHTRISFTSTWNKNSFSSLESFLSLFLKKKNNSIIYFQWNEWINSCNAEKDLIISPVSKVSNLNTGQTIYEAVLSIFYCHYEMYISQNYDTLWLKYMCNFSTFFSIYLPSINVYWYNRNNAVTWVQTLRKWY